MDKIHWGSPRYHYCATYQLNDVIDIVEMVSSGNDTVEWKHIENDLFRINKTTMMKIGDFELITQFVLVHYSDARYLYIDQYLKDVSSVTPSLLKTAMCIFYIYAGFTEFAGTFLSRTEDRLMSCINEKEAYSKRPTCVTYLFELLPFSFNECNFISFELINILNIPKSISNMIISY